MKEIHHKETDTFLENCRYLGLKNLEGQWESLIGKASRSEVGFYDFLFDVIQSEANNRRERSIRYRIKQSRLPQPLKLLSDFDFAFQPRLKKKLIMDLATMDFMRQHQSILYLGNCGTGKSHLAQALALISFRG
jgi:DNA replication protein DnaC